MQSLHRRMSKDETEESHKSKRLIQKGKSTTKCKKPQKHFSKISFNMTKKKKTTKQSKIRTVACQNRFASFREAIT